MIAWPKTAPHLDSPSSLYAYLKTPPENPDLSLSKTIIFHRALPDIVRPGRTHRRVVRASGLVGGVEIAEAEAHPAEPDHDGEAAGGVRADAARQN